MDAQVGFGSADQFENEVQGVDEDEVADAPLPGPGSRTPRSTPVCRHQGCLGETEPSNSDHSFKERRDHRRDPAHVGMRQEPDLTAQETAVEPLVELAQVGAGSALSSMAACSWSSRSQKSALSTGSDMRRPRSGRRGRRRRAPRWAPPSWRRSGRRPAGRRAGGAVEDGSGVGLVGERAPGRHGGTPPPRCCADRGPIARRPSPRPGAGRSWPSWSDVDPEEPDGPRRNRQVIPAGRRQLPVLAAVGRHFPCLSVERGLHGEPVIPRSPWKSTTTTRPTVVGFSRSTCHHASGDTFTSVAQ